ncbi:Uncharacterized protein Rs2_16850 [Raphanus sativus]|uniref:Uncharacterized protein LOC108852718 n=1 Tax=Raphanus sativus TaxID=3726 RepID=A0A6J0NAG7_RAPSA|nr:uncharacterized protein LOC108852718 [Raphanus sativus]KAJ4902899.1 Uncharacterized protein Rs2_16850 [Raphanus sativus]
MAENVGSVESEFGSVTSSQISFLKNCPFADPLNGAAKQTDSDTTEVLGTPVARTPLLSSLSTPIGLDSVNDEDVFRTPPENASLSSSSAAESEPRARVSKLKSKSPPPVSASASLAVRNLRVLETNRIADDPEEPVPGGGGSESKSKSPPPVRVLEMNRVSDPEERVTEVRTLTSPPSPAAGNVRVPGSNFVSESPSPPTVAAGDVRVPAKRSGLDSPSPGKHSDLDSSPPSATEGIKSTESGDDCEIEIPFKEVIEALLRNSGENLDERDERVSYVDILKQCGLKFP